MFMFSIFYKVSLHSITGSALPLEELACHAKWVEKAVGIALTPVIHDVFLADKYVYGMNYACFVSQLNCLKPQGFWHD